MKLLIVKPTALGDVAHALQAVPQLKSSGKVDHLGWVVDEDYAPLLRLFPEIDEIIPFPRRKWKKRFSLPDIWRWGRALRARGYDTVLDLQGLARSGLMTWASGAPRRIGLKSAREGAGLAYTEIVDDWQTHAIDRYRAACDHVAGKLDAPDLPGRRGEGVMPLPLGLKAGEYTVLHPYSLWETKLWPWCNYQLLVEALPDETFVVIGKGEIFPISGPNVIDLRNRTESLTSLLALLSQARLLISTDSGPAHIATALGCPVICIFGATDPCKTGPKGRDVEILFKEVECRPCLRRTCQYRIKMACLRSLGVLEVAKTWEKMVKNSQFA